LERIHQTPLFVLEEVLVNLQIIAIAQLVTQEINVKLLFALEKTHLTLMFAQGKDLVTLLKNVIAQLVTQVINVK
jgi:hypothetical protein